MKKTNKIKKRERARLKTRARIAGTENRPRLSVFKSNKHLYAQAINDEKGVIICGVSDFNIKGKKTERAKKIGELIAKKLLGKEIKRVIFDRSGYRYTGVVKELGDSINKQGGISFS